MNTLADFRIARNASRQERKDWKKRISISKYRLLSNAYANNSTMIGIVGGVGPYAGLDLMRKVFDNTLAHCDQDHVDALLFSHSSKIVDRTEYLEGREQDNPAEAE